jgi:16S rRNA (adenine1518-N6/adenine1519-N6)-dimethyltransferase
VLLVQREVAQRVVAPPGRDAGLLTVLVQRAFETRLHLEVPPQAFYPAPKVHSAVLVLQRRKALLSAPLDSALVWTARAAYAARRKTLTNTLSLGCQVPKAQIAALLEALDISPAQRPEALSLPQLTQIAAALAQAGLVP